jgi:hypothetical protein
MNNILRFAIIGMLAFSLHGCKKEMSPLVSGQVSYLQADGKSDQEALTKDQLNELTLWLNKHRSGWIKSVVEPPFSQEEFNLTLIHESGGTTNINFSNLDGVYEAVIEGAGVPDQSFDSLKARYFYQSIPETDINSLRSLLEKK